MSINKRTYSPLTNTTAYNAYSYSSTLSPSYSYSRVTSYLDAIEKDQTITKLRKELSDVRSLQMKYHSMMQEIHLAQKENQILQIKNQEVQKDYLQKIKNVKTEVQTLKANLSETQQAIQQEEQSTKQVQMQIQKLIEELKLIKADQQTTAQQSSELENQIKSYKTQCQNLKEQSQVLKGEKAKLQSLGKQIAEKMEISSSKMSQLNESIQKEQEEVESLLRRQLKNSQVQANHLSAISEKNMALIENHLRKSTIQEGQIQQLKMQLAQLRDQLFKQQKFERQKKDQLYKFIVGVQQKSSLSLQNLLDVEKLLVLDNTSKQYYLDMQTKLQKLKISNQNMQEMGKYLQEQLHQAQLKQYKLLKQANCNMQTDFIVKKMLDKRLQSQVATQ